VNLTENLRTTRCCYCSSITLMIPCRFEMAQMCIDCRKSAHKETVEGDYGIINELCNQVLAWKREAIKRGYKNPIRLAYEDVDGKGVKEKNLVDMWTKLIQENAVLKNEIANLKDGDW